MFFLSPLGQFNIETIWIPFLKNIMFSNHMFIWIIIVLISIIIPSFMLDKIEVRINNQKIKNDVDSIDFLTRILNFIPYFFSKENVLLFKRPLTFIFGIVFFFILFSNIYGLLPYADTITATLHVPFFLSFSLFIAMNIYAIILYKEDVLGFFVPSAPWLMKPLLFVVELISHIMKCISLSVRLFANLFAGHVLMHILGGSISFMILIPGLALLTLIGPFLIFSIICIMEIFVAGLQAYVFVTLVSMYFGDLLNIDENAH